GFQKRFFAGPALIKRPALQRTGQSALRGDFPRSEEMLGDLFELKVFLDPFDVAPQLARRDGEHRKLARMRQVEAKASRRRQARLALGPDGEFNPGWRG